MSRSTHVALALLGFCATASAAKPRDDYRPAIDPEKFHARIDNPYLPLAPGTRFELSEKSEGKTYKNVIEVTSDEKTIMGVTCTIVHDTVLDNERVVEETWDWFAQDDQGNVWYFGEDTKEFEPSGKMSTAGSWEAGINGAQPGIIMFGMPAPGEPYRQEYEKDDAEDMGQILSVGQSVTVPAGTYKDCVKTKEWSLLESGHENKWYCRGVGVVREEGSNKEVAELLSVKAP